MNFAFTIDSKSHRPYKIFFEIMALEKILKAFLLLSNSALYVSLSQQDAEEKIEEIAKKGAKRYE